jgi:hypothetical protein
MSISTKVVDQGLGADNPSASPLLELSEQSARCCGEWIALPADTAVIV